MKRLIMVLLMLVVSTLAGAQSSRKAYCEIIGTESLPSRDFLVTIDLGQATPVAGTNFVNTNSILAVTFISLEDAMNWMGERGWKFIQAYELKDCNRNTYHWVLMKTVKTNDEIYAGLTNPDANKKGN